VVVEGYTDCIMAHQVGVTHVVATLGTSFAAGHARLLRRYAKRVILLFDGDVAGAAAANRALEVCLRQGIDIYVAAISGGADPCDFIIENGADALREVLDRAEDVITFKWSRLTERFETDRGMAGRKEALEDYLQTIAAAIHAGQVSSLDRGLILNRLSSVLGLSAREIDEELSRRAQRLQREPKPSAPTVESSGEPGLELQGKAALEREILEVLLGDPALFNDIKSLVTPDFFEQATLKAIAVHLFEALEANAGVKVSEVLARIESVELAQAITTLIHEGSAKGNFTARLQGIRARMRRGSGGFGIMN
jgi:DNA primase